MNQHENHNLVGPGNFEELREILVQRGVDFEAIIELRHDIHKHPETAFQEFETQRKIRSRLLEFGIEESSIKDCAKTGLVADISGTAEASPSGECGMVAFRADIDALAMAEENPGIDYASSVANVAHMCGHDGHICTLLSTAQFWSLHRHLIPSNKTIRLLFQPAEESQGGAMPMIKEGCLEGVDEIYGYHNWPTGYEGSISVKAGPMQAGVTKVCIVVEGDDAITAACQIHNALHTIKSRKLLNNDVLAFTIWQFVAEEGEGEESKNAMMKGSIRYFDEVVRDNAVMKIEQIATSIAKGFDCESTISFNNMYPPAINHDKQAEIVKNLAKECLGSDNVNTTYGVPMFASDDISYFLKERPGAYIYLNNIKTGGKPLSLHTPYMDFNDNIISTGVYLNIKISEDRLGISLL